jgi:hypothetical protein
MTAQPLIRQNARARLPSEYEANLETRFETELETLVDRYAGIWRRMGDAEPIPGEMRSWYSQWTTARQARQLVGFVAGEIEELPPEVHGRSSWRARLEDEIRRFGSERLSWPAGYGSLVLGDEFFDSTVEFVRAAREFDPELEAGDIGQALRNVWIVNSLQMLLDLPVTMTPAVFAYSLLYPYTDNYLDDAQVPSEDKQVFVDKLGHRLDGERIHPRDRQQDRIFELVGVIEEEFDRTRSPDVFSSLKAIHQAQRSSLEQQGGSGKLSDDETLAISISKGGASVLADGYLAAGTLSSAEADFCFGYGVLLQLLDDLQDAKVDSQVGHQTIFSRRLGRDALDSDTSRLYQFMQRAVASAARLDGPEFADRKDLILRNCSALLVGAVAENPDLFSRGFVRRLQRRWPLRFRAVRRLSRQAKRKFSDASSTLCERQGVESVLELI